MATRDKLTIIEKAYTAGLFDGEGSVTIESTHKSNPNYKSPQHVLILTCTNNHKATIEWLHDKFGCSKAMRKRFRDNKKWRACYTWNATSYKALNFLKIIYPYLRIKKDQAKLGIEFQETRNNNKKLVASGIKNGYVLSQETLQRRENYSLKMKELNKREYL